VSWLAQRDVDEGRRELNFSEWDRPQKEAHESAKTVRRGSMPPWFYVLPRPHARLSAAERDALIAGLEATFGTSKRRAGRDRRDRREWGGRAPPRRGVTASSGSAGAARPLEPSEFDDLGQASRLPHDARRRRRGGEDEHVGPDPCPQLR
jgi:hypothetical protein